MFGDGSLTLRDFAMRRVRKRAFAGETDEIPVDEPEVVGDRISHHPGFPGAGQRNMPAKWFDKTPHNHMALDDAIGQGVLFCNILAAVRGADA